MSIDLSAPSQAFIEAQVAAGVFREPNEVVEAAIQLLREQAVSEYEETVAEIEQAAADIEALRGRTVAQADAAIRAELGFSAEAS